MHRIQVFSGVPPFRILAAIAALLLASCASLPRSAFDEVKLFNGQDLTGWESFSVEPEVPVAEVWMVEDGLLQCNGEPNGYLCTTSEHEDYSLVVEWRWPREPGNSGVLLRMAREERFLPSCAEAQLKHGSVGLLYGFHDFRIGGDEERLSEIGLPGWKLERLADAERPAGEWNRYDITVAGDTITVVLNGELVNTATGCDVRAGRIGLQSEGAPIEFRTVLLTLR